MTDYKIQFDADDVFRRFEEIRNLQDKQRDGTLGVIHHELISEFSAIHAFIDVFKINVYGEFSNIHQLAYLDNLDSKAALVNCYLKELVNLCRDRESDVSCDMNKCSEDLVDLIQSIPQYLPVKERVLELGNMCEKGQEALENIDSIYNIIFYTYNLEFAKAFQREKYILGNDLRSLWIANFSETENPIKMNKPNFRGIETKVNYFKNAIMPLIKNIQHHAFNPENDVYGRLNNPKGVSKLFDVEEEIDEEKKEIIITVADRGFGIRPEIQEKLFQKGTSTKTDNKIEHGIGLWAVKEFVEANGGKIWCETELGKGTSFKFIIPYKEKVSLIYKQ